MKRKLQHFEELKSFGNVFDRTCALKGLWNNAYFTKTAPIVLELGCGRGEYTIQMAQEDPSNNYIGIDLKGARLWRGAKTAWESAMGNVAFLRIQIEHLDQYFAPGEISEIWITFPDPHPSHRREKKRLTAPRFLTMYRSLLVPGGKVHLKTDSQPLKAYSEQCVAEFGGVLLSACNDVHGDGCSETLPYLSIQTTYEALFLKAGKKITYLMFNFRPPS